MVEFPAGLERALGAVRGVTGDTLKWGVAFIAAMAVKYPEVYSKFIDSVLSYIGNEGFRTAVRLFIDGAVFWLAKEFMVDSDNELLRWAGAFIGMVPLYDVIRTVVYNIGGTKCGYGEVIKKLEELKEIINAGIRLIVAEIGALKLHKPE